jgi:O-antigen ligase
MSIDFTNPSTLITLLAALGAAAVGVIAAGMLLRRPALLAYPFLLLMFTVPESTLAVANAGVPIWSRGSGQLLFPFVQWGVLGGLFWSVVSNRFQGRPMAIAPVAVWLLGFAAMLLGHLVVGVWLGEEVRHILGPMGFVNLVWMAIFVLLLVNAFRTEHDVLRLMDFIIVMAAARAVYGLVRFAAFGGDPSNVYQNMEKLALKITFFDISDSMLMTIGAVLALLRAIGPPTPERTAFRRALNIGVVLLCAATIALTFRRTLQGGFVLAMLVVMVGLPRRQQVIGVLLGLPALLGAVAIAAGQRLAQVRAADDAGLLVWLYDILPDPYGPDNQRIMELRLAWQSFIESPILGIGSWGQYEGANMIFWQTGERAGDFLHSGLLHLGLKAGIVGLVLFAIVAVVYVRSARREPGVAPSPLDPLRIAGLAGMAFVIPDMIIGTPLIQVRTTLMWGLCLALPTISRVLDPQPGRFEALPAPIKRPVRRPARVDEPETMAGAAAGSR